MPRSILLAMCLLFAAAVARGDGPSDPQARAFWAFQKLSAPVVPPAAAGGRGRNEVDAFIEAKLSARRLTLSPVAERLTLLRRASLDLLGLPPTPQQMAEFLADERPDAYERLIDRLLASPQFGQRWGRHWLDAAGYSDITGGDNDAGIVKLSEARWKYRDYVVRSFNADKPYDRFLVEQLAGDELVDWRGAKSLTPEMKELLVATGFLRTAADDTDEKELTTPDILHGILQRTTEVVANGVLGLTLACAKCHDHKYEPILQQDYYSLVAVFAPIYNTTAWLPPKTRALADIAPSEKTEAEKFNAELDRQIAELVKRQADLKRPVEERLLADKLAQVSEPIRADVKAAVQTAADKRNEVQKYLAGKFAAMLAIKADEVKAALSPEDRSKLAEAESHAAALKGQHRTWGTIQAAYDVGPPPTTHLLARGNHETPAEAVQPGGPAFLHAATGANLCAAQPAGQTSGRRLALAAWLTDWQAPSGGLAARVFVNRTWQHLFGRGIVETAENLGVSGAPPSHPELLEWLACRFVADGRQPKSLIRLLMTSATYRQASAVNDARLAAAAQADPDNRLLWRMPLKRVEAEIVRDALLAVGDNLDASLDGPPLPLEVKSDGMVVLQSKDKPASALARRSFYVLARRNYHLSILNVFDQPAMATNCAVRQQSAVVLQSLAMLNDSFVLQQARRFAQRVRASAPAPAEQIRLAFRVALAREASAQELAWGQEFVEEQAAELAGAALPAEQIAEKSLAQLCHMLLGSNEFLYVP